MKFSVGKKLAATACATMTVLALGACSASTSASSANATSSSTAAASSASSSASASDTAGGTSTSTASTAAAASTSTQTSSSATPASLEGIGTVPNTIAQDEAALVSTYVDKFTQQTYTDPDTGLSVTYNLYLPAGYDASQSYPMVVFIGDSTCAGTDATRSLNQGLGALVWASDEWQAAHPSIVCVPTYPETILDDHNSYSKTEYVELTKRLIDSVSSSYAVNKGRIYGTGQSMGCMTTLVLASEYPDLYAACMFVDGQWDVSTLSGLENQTFVYFAAEDDKSAYTGMSEVMKMFDTDSVAYSYAQWDGTWSPDELSAAAVDLFSAGKKANFISWKTGTIDASSGMSSMGGGSRGGNSSSASAQGGNAGSSMQGGASGQPSGSTGSQGGSQSSSGGGAGMGSVGYHMASFDYAYNCIAVMEWLFQQGA